jgi:hypothetical protein
MFRVITKMPKNIRYCHFDNFYSGPDKKKGESWPMFIAATSVSATIIGVVTVGFTIIEERISKS